MRWLVALVVAGCAARAASGTAPTAPSGAAEEEARHAEVARDAGAIVCAPGAKEERPCVEDCDRGVAFACAELAARADHARDLPRAVSLHERACELRDAPSCVSAARMHAGGLGVPPSRAKQVELLSAACRLGDAVACAVPAKALMSGSGVPKDERRALDLWQRACAAGAEPACDIVTDAGL